MVYYVVYKASRDYSNRSLIPARLRALGCKQMNKTFWEFNKEEIHKVMKLLEMNQPILLKRIREVKRRLMVNGRIQDLGSLVVVTFKIPKEESERIRSLVEKAPCIRLCRLVYAFNQRHSTLDPEGKLMDANHLATFIEELGGEVKLIPKIVVLGQRSIQRLVDETEQRMEKEILDITRKCRQIYDRYRRTECNNEELGAVLRKLRRRYAMTKAKSRFYDEWLELNLSRELAKAYKALLKLRRSSLQLKSFA